MLTFPSHQHFVLNQRLQGLKAVYGFVKGLNIEVHCHAAIVQGLINFALH